jgi:hypothetical protein
LVLHDQVYAGVGMIVSVFAGVSNWLNVVSVEGVCSLGR